MYVLIPIIDNNIVEDVENFSLSIQIPPEFVDIGVRLGTLSMATGFIIDDDGKPLENHCLNIHTDAHTYMHVCTHLHIHMLCILACKPLVL